MNVAIIDYGAGNLRSAAKAFEAASAASRHTRIAVTRDPGSVVRADRVVLPGDGAFGDCRRGLQTTDGMIEAIDRVIESGRPFFGICVGMQLLASAGFEHGRTDGLNKIAGEVRRIEPDDHRLKVPHMGWNTLEQRRPHALLRGLPLGADGWHAYFLHAYHFVPEHSEDVVATAEYGGEVTAVIARENIAGSQFHPEKSQKLGLALISNFLNWSP